MADKKKKVEKEPGRIKQLWQVLNLTRKTDKLLVPILILTFLAPLGAGITVALLLSGGSVLPHPVHRYRTAVVGAGDPDYCGSARGKSGV